MTDCSYKLNKVAPTAKTTATTVATLFFYNCVSPYGIRSKVLTANSPHFASKLFKANCVELVIVSLKKTEYYPQCNGQLEACNTTVVSRLQHYVSEHPQDWDFFEMPRTYTYNTQIHRTTKQPHFSLVLSRQPCTPGTSTEKPMPSSGDLVDTSLAMRTRLIRRAAKLKWVAEIFYERCKAIIC